MDVTAGLGDGRLTCAVCYIGCWYLRSSASCRVEESGEAAGGTVEGGGGDGEERVVGEVDFAVGSNRSGWRDGCGCRHRGG